MKIKKVKFLRAAYLMPTLFLTVAANAQSPNISTVGSEGLALLNIVLIAFSALLISAGVARAYKEKG